MESPSTVAEYSMVNVPFGVSRLMVKLILLPVIVPSNGASPRRPVSVPLILPPSWVIVRVWVIGPFGPWDDISQVPAAFAGSSAALTVSAQISNKPHVNANVKKQAILFIEASPLLGCQIDSISRLPIAQSS